jgi:hypothetical protein
MPCRVLFLLILLGSWCLFVRPGAADDADRCFSATAREGIAARDRVIGSGNHRPIGLTGLDPFAAVNRRVQVVNMLVE